MDSDLVTKQQVALDSLLSGAPSDWRTMFVNFEFRDGEEGWTANFASYAVKKTWLSKPRVEQFDISTNAHMALIRLCKALAEASGSSELTVDFLVFRKNRFQMYVDYSPPFRLNLESLATSHERHLKYLDQEPLLAMIGT